MSHSGLLKTLYCSMWSWGSGLELRLDKQGFQDLVVSIDRAIALLERRLSNPDLNFQAYVQP